MLVPERHYSELLLRMNPPGKVVPLTAGIDTLHSHDAKMFIVLEQGDIINQIKCHIPVHLHLPKKIFDVGARTDLLCQFIKFLVCEC